MADSQQQAPAAIADSQQQAPAAIADSQQQAPAAIADSQQQALAPIAPAPIAPAQGSGKRPRSDQGALSSVAITPLLNDLSRSMVQVLKKKQWKYLVVRNMLVLILKKGEWDNAVMSWTLQRSVNAMTVFCVKGNFSLMPLEDPMGQFLLEWVVNLLRLCV